MIRYISRMPDRAWEDAAPRTVALLGSTGSIGTSALKVIEAHPGLFRVAALAGARNVRLLAEQATRHRPAHLGVLDEAGAAELRALLPAGYAPDIHVGPEGYAILAALPDVSTVLSAQVGAAGLRATVAAARAGKVICLANKESLVLAGALIRQICAETGAVVLPVDSEHNAVFQALRVHDVTRAPHAVRRIILTASGGPFRGRDRAFLSSVTREQALNHPNWSMGAKITIDSATLMNKGLEVIEAYHLYGVAPESIEVVVHPQSIVHSLVEYADGSQIAHLGTPDMRIAIAYCMAWPRCVDTGVAPLDLVRAGSLTFEAPDLSSFPCLALARRVLAREANTPGGAGLPVVLNAANEAAVELFLHGRIGFMNIPELIERALDAHEAEATNAEAPDSTATKNPDNAHTDRYMPMHDIDHIEALDAATRRRVRHWADAAGTQGTGNA
ncbi:1-deoxy-D-xylulose-5-phosphate reductoisomerase [Nitratidesulfovibrio liaohensis]|uniref:1-deoxy-D-xylulose 5-phosphate reductoisomerase n=1 Tax=Nitratidesulfovibrio liaohensis TaxID=2604158 RepID=A0ABY9R0E4_9BACT|nr:1-deoxy-D-xylulose-5-phosphate reductoisomerase [Nitratidesulfovibrio liaohensis]WMW65246.1 1-deoxy-D-xylulose-5-phosphate reductoisomerase [Nitratidesulfovibrio liaohensis]